jgi:hypothetical protein
MVMSESGRPAGIGERGELVVHSRNPAIGYLDADGTADDFGVDPATGLAVLRTGDRARIDGSGRIHLCGRTDRQASIGGHRVELGEVEAAALRHPAVRQAIASLRRTDGGSVLDLHVTTAPNRSVTAGELRAHLRALLPAHAVPVAIPVERLSLGVTQKIQPARTPETPRRPAAQAPRDQDDTTRLIAARIAEFIGREIAPEENFFDAGLNSLALLQLHRAIAADVPVPFPVTALFRHPNLRALAGYLAGHERARVSRGLDPAVASRWRLAAEARRRVRRQARTDRGHRG